MSEPRRLLLRVLSQGAGGRTRLTGPLAVDREQLPDTVTSIVCELAADLLTDQPVVTRGSRQCFASGIGTRRPYDGSGEP